MSAELENPGAFLMRVKALADSLSGDVGRIVIGSRADPATWQINFGPSVSAEDAAAVLAQIRAHDFDAPTAGDVRAEASRRMQRLVSARDAEHLAVIISNAQREAIRLLRVGVASWTPEQAARAAELEAADAAIEAIRAASNALEASPPANYADDQNWP
jgi:translation initiation factor 2B subunit (eIF-2B alpha/beta/delta family)